MSKNNNYISNDVQTSKGVYMRRTIIGGIFSGFGLGIGGLGLFSAFLNFFKLTQVFLWSAGLVVGYVLIQFLDNKYGKPVSSQHTVYEKLL